MAPRSPRSTVEATTDRVTYDATYPEGMCVNWFAKKHPSAIPASARTVGAIRSKRRRDCETPLAGSRSGMALGLLDRMEKSITSAQLSVTGDYTH
jgi:hypothetical protein